MRIIIFIPFLLLLPELFCQLDGTYVSFSYLGRTEFTFNNDQTFQYAFFSREKPLIGEGVYSLKKDTLIIDWVTHRRFTDTKCPNETIESSQVDGSGDSVFFEIHSRTCYNENPLPFTSIILYDAKSGNELMRYETGFDGIGKFKLEKTTDPIIVATTCLEFHPQQIKLVYNDDHYFKIVLYSPIIERVDYMHGDVREYYIIENRDDESFYLFKTESEKKEKTIFARWDESWNDSRRQQFIQEYFPLFFKEK
jgi:hypothetical protein